MTVREYIGARYVPIFADPIEWDNTNSYEPLTVVKHEGASYVSRQSVPEGIALDNTTYWILWADYNAQIEAYRREVQQFDARITANTEGVEDNTADIAAIKTDDWVTTPRIANNAVTMDKFGSFTGKKITIFGDSTMIETSDGSPLGSWIAAVTGATVDNQAVGGTMIPAFKTILQGKTSDDFADSDFIFIAYGSNDWQNSENLWSIFIPTYLECLDMLDTLAPHCQIVLFTPAGGIKTFAGQNGTQDDYNLQGQLLEDYANAILHIANVHQVNVFDSFHKFNINRSNYSRWLIVSAGTNIYLHYRKELKNMIAQAVNMWEFGPSEFTFNNMQHNQISSAAATYNYAICSTSRNTALVNAAVGAGFPITESPFYETTEAQRSFSFTDVELTGDDTLSFYSNYAGGYLQINVGSNRLLEIVTGYGMHTIHLRGFTGKHNITFVKVTNETNNSMVIGNPTIAQGHAYAPNYEFVPSKYLKLCNSTGVQLGSSFTGGSAQTGITGEDRYIYVYNVEASSAITAGTELLKLPTGFIGGVIGQQILFGSYYTGATGYMPCVFAVSADDVYRSRITVLTPIPQGAKVYIAQTVRPLFSQYC